MSGNRERAHRVWNEALCNSGVPGWDRLAALEGALDEAEARGRAEVAAKVSAVADGLAGGSPETKKMRGFIAEDIRAIVAEVTA